MVKQTDEGAPSDAEGPLLRVETLKMWITPDPPPPEPAGETVFELRKKEPVFELKNRKDSGRRAMARVAFRIAIHHTSQHNFYMGFSEDIGTGGLFVATHAPATIGDQVLVTFSLPGLREEWTTPCRVRWIREYNPDAIDTVPGIGLEFISLKADARSAIQRFFKRRAPIFFE